MSLSWHKRKTRLSSLISADGGEDAEGSTEDESDDDESGDETEGRGMSAPPPPNNQARDPIWGDDSQDVHMEVEQQAPTPAPLEVDGAKVRPDRFVEYYQVLEQTLTFLLQITVLPYKTS